MKISCALMVGAVSMIVIATSAGEVSAQGEDPNPNQKKKRWDRVKMVADVGGMTLGAATFNPFLVGFSTGRLIRNTYQLGKHSSETRNPSASATPTSIAQPESLVAVPARPGYFYYPSNPNQLYFDANAVPRMSVLIVNPAKNGQTVTYTVSGTKYVVPPGYTQALTTPTGSIISFEPVDSAGAQRLLLSEGRYEFRRVEQSWRFYATDGPAREIADAAEKAAKGQNSTVAR